MQSRTHSSAGKLLAIVMALALIVGLLPGTALTASAVAYEPIDLDNGNSDGNGCGWTYTANTHTLTLKGYEFSGRGYNYDSPSHEYAAVYYNNDIPLNIVVMDGTQNSIVLDGAEDAQAVFGICAQSGVNISGFGSLEITVGGGSGLEYGFGILGSNIVVKGATLTVVAKRDGVAFTATNGTVINYVPGTGWDDAAGTGDGTPIDINTDGAKLSYKKVSFAPEPVAQIVHLDDKTEPTAYYTLEKAIVAFDESADASIELLDDLMVNEDFTIPKNFTLDLGGNTLAVKGKINILQDVAVTLDGTGTLTVHPKELSTTAIQGGDGAKLTVDGPAVYANGTDSNDGAGGHGIYNVTLEIQSGTVIAQGGDSTKDGGAGGKGIYGSVTVSADGELHAYGGDAEEDAGGGGHAIDGDLTVIDGGTVTATGGNGDGLYYGRGVTGKITGIAEESDDDEIWTKLSGTESVAQYVRSMPTPVATVCEIDSLDEPTVYYSFEAALKNWGDGKVLTLLANVETSTTIAIVSSSKVLDLNGHGILMIGDSAVVVIREDASLTLKDDAETKPTHYLKMGGLRARTVSDTASDDAVAVVGGYIAGGNSAYAGGVMVQGGCVFTMEGGTIIGNLGGQGGGVYVANGINTGTFIMSGGAIVNNTASYDGGGVYVAGGYSKQSYDPAIFKVSGGVRITGNSTRMDEERPEVVSNVSLHRDSFDNEEDYRSDYDAVIMIEDALSSDTTIGVTLAKGHNGVFTSGLTAENAETYASYFFGDDGLDAVVETAEGVSQNQLKLGKAPIYYINHTVDAGTGAVMAKTEACTNYTVLTSDTKSLLEGTWYVVKTDTTLIDRPNVLNGGSVHLILCDGVTLTAPKGIMVNSKSSYFNIYAGSTSKDVEGTGTLIATGTNHSAGIGGDDVHNAEQDQMLGGGRIRIHGGIVTATGDSTGGNGGAGIGGGYHGSGGTVTIYDGTVTAKSSGMASGIGHGDSSSDGGITTIYGGTVYADGASGGSYGIGGGEYTLTIGDGMHLYAANTAEPEKDPANYIAGAGEYSSYHYQYMTVTDEAPTPVATVGKIYSDEAPTTYYSFATALENWKSGDILTLLTDVTLDGSIDVEGDDSKELNLNGYGILSTGDGYALGVSDNASLTIMDKYEGARPLHFIVVNDKGYGVEVVDKAPENGDFFPVMGGYITGARSHAGAIIAWNSGLYLNGGTIAGNHTGVVAAASIHVSGSPTVVDNVEENIFLNDSAFILANDLKKSAQLGVTMLEGEGRFTIGLSDEGTLENFFSDSSIYTVIPADEGEAALAASHRIIIPEMAHGTVAAKIGDGVIETTLTGSEVDLVATPASGYRLKSGSLKVMKPGKTLDDEPELVAVTNNSFVMPAADVIVSAEFEVIPTPTPTPSDNDSGGYSGGGGGGVSTPTTTTVTVPVSGDSNSVNVSVTISGETATVRDGNLDSVLSAAADTGTVTIDVSGTGREITEAVIPSTMVDKITEAVADENNDANGLEVKLSTGTVTFDATALEAISDQMTGRDLRLNLDSIGENNLNAAQKTAAESLNVQQVFDAYMTSNNQRISDFRGGVATVSIPYTLKNGQVGRGLSVWYIADSGERAEMPTTYVSGTVEFTTTHFSNYVLVYDETRAGCPQDYTCPIAAFIDTEPTAWYHDGVHFVLENGIMGGYGDGRFGPDDATSRAMMAQILWNLEKQPYSNFALFYTDVDQSMWYAEAIRWAASENVMTGYSDDLFGPTDSLTREQLVTIVYRYALLKGVDVSVGKNTNLLSFGDAFNVADWAMSAMQWAIGSGVITGRPDGSLDPKTPATRAEIATIMQRFVSLVN